MIVDHLSNATKYEKLSPAFKLAMEFLLAHPDGISEDRIDINEDVYVLRKQYNSKNQDDCKWEAHKEFIDVQYVAHGSECMGWGPRGAFDVVEYKEAKDFIHLTGEGNFFPLKDKMFMILFPEDAHMPNVKLGESCPIEKIIVKVRVGK